MSADRPTKSRLVILGAAGRDFHNFNMLYRNDASVEVVAFTAAQIPRISGRRYPPELAGAFYPQGIPIVEESELEAVARREKVTEVMFAYSDVTNEAVMHLASRALALGAGFLLAGPDATMLKAHLPVIAVGAVRTGCGKSQVTRFLSQHLRRRGLRAAVLRHPMPYGDLARERVQRFASRADLDAADCTIEEREEYEPHIAAGNVVYAGVDYGEILARAEEGADVVLWDGGNNDFPFVRPDLFIVLVDALRPGQLATHHPGEAALRMADIVVVAKVNSARAADVERLILGAEAINPRALVVRGDSPVTLDDPAAVEGRRVLVVEDGPSITHGGLPYGAGYVAVERLEGVHLVDPRASATPEIRAFFERYPHIGLVLPALGYDAAERAALEETINRSEADVVVAATPVDLTAILALEKPVVRARYGYADAGTPRLAELVDRFLAGRGKG